jgi:hypothetical protein
MTTEYEIALAKANYASKIYNAIAADYRARKIGDAEYLAGRALHEAAKKEFDEAFAKEAGWTE